MKAQKSHWPSWGLIGPVEEHSFQMFSRSSAAPRTWFWAVIARFGITGSVAADSKELVIVLIRKGEGIIAYRFRQGCKCSRSRKIAQPGRNQSPSIFVSGYKQSRSWISFDGLIRATTRLSAKLLPCAVRKMGVSPMMLPCLMLLCISSIVHRTESRWTGWVTCVLHHLVRRTRQTKFFGRPQLHHNASLKVHSVRNYNACDRALAWLVMSNGYS